MGDGLGLSFWFWKFELHVGFSPQLLPFGPLFFINTLAIIHEINLFQINLMAKRGKQNQSNYTSPLKCIESHPGIFLIKWSLWG